MSLTLQTVPQYEVYPVTLALVKQNSVVEHALDDSLLAFYIRAATNYVEDYIGKDIISRTWDYSFDEFPISNIICLPKTPVLDITSITYYDYSGSPVLNTLATSVYTLDTGKSPAEIHLQYGQTWPAVTFTHNSITVRFRTGFMDTNTSPNDDTTVPSTIKEAVLMVVDDMYRNRASQDTIKLYKNMAVEMMLDQNKEYSL